MKALLRHFLAGTTLALAVSAAIGAEPFPSRPIRIILNTAPGGLLDSQTRLVALEMAKDLGQPVVIENRTGADGLIGIRYVKTVPADGYTLLSSANTFAQNPALKGDSGYVVKDFVGIGMFSQYPLIMITATSHPEKTMADVIARAKANPEKLTYSSGGVGTSTHMAAALFVSNAGVRMLHVPYKGNAAGQPDVLAGRININFDGANAVLPQMKEGRLRALGVTTAKRSASFPEIPTLAEQGLPNYNFVAYGGLMAPAATPKEVVQRLHQALRTALNSEVVRERFARDGQEAGTMTPEEFTSFLQEDEKRTAKLAKELDLR